MLPFRPLIAFTASASLVISTNAILVRHLRTQVSDKEVFHDVSPTGSFLIVGSCRAIRQEDEVEMDEVESSERPCFCLSAPPSPVPYV